MRVWHGEAAERMKGKMNDETSLLEMLSWNLYLLCVVRMVEVSCLYPPVASLEPGYRLFCFLN